MTQKIFDPTKPVRTRDGRPVRILCTDRKGIDGRSIVCLVQSKNEEGIFRYYPDGRTFLANDPRGYPMPVDLVNVPVRTSTWENVYRSVSGGVCYPTKEAAAKTIKPIKLGYLRRDFEDGVFVSAEFEPLTNEE